MKRVSASTVGRLSLYLRLLAGLEEEGVTSVSSGALAKRAGSTAAQVRKDLSSFGTFGKRGLGYPVSELGTALRSILGLERRWSVALVGAGRIGMALLGYDDFRRQGFDIECAFDADRSKVGHERHGVTIRADAEMERDLVADGIDIVIVAVPVEVAQEVVDRVVRSGIRAILNFAPIRLRVPAGVSLKNVNMALEMESLSYALSGGSGRRRSLSAVRG